MKTKLPILLVLTTVILFSSCVNDSSRRALKLQGVWEVTKLTIDEQDFTDSLFVLQVNYQFDITGTEEDTYELGILSGGKIYYADMLTGSDETLLIYNLDGAPIPGFGALVNPTLTGWDVQKLTGSEMILSTKYMDGRVHKITFKK